MTPTLHLDPYTWEADGETFFAPRIEFDTMTWHSHHTVSEGCDEVDGYFAYPDGTRRGLDIWAADASATADLRGSYPDAPAQAAKAWEAGGVLFLSLWPDSTDSGCPSLIVPGKSVTPELILEALTRHTR